MTAEEVAAAHPDPVQAARILREVFGEGVRLAYALNKASGERLGKPTATPDSHKK